MPDGNLKGSRCESSRYRGDCDVYGKRNGFGAEKWVKPEQKFVGNFVRDAFHGDGAYEWFTGRERLVFEGQFYSNFKEGYGLVSLPDGSVFEGLFSNNRPHGPGVKTHLNGRQDVGFWCGNRIVRLSRSVDCIVPRLASSSAGKLKLLRFQAIIPFAEKDADVGAALLTKHGLDPNQSCRLYSDLIHDPRSIFFDTSRLDDAVFAKVTKGQVQRSNSSSSKANSRFGVSSPGDGVSRIRRLPSANPDGKQPHPPRGRVVKEHKPAADLLWFEASEGVINGSSMAFVSDATENTPTRSKEKKVNVIDDAGSNSGVSQLLSWNRSELCMEMLKQIFRFRSSEGKLTFKISDLMAGARTKFRKTGETERLNLHFLKMCSIGPAYMIKDLLCSKSISEALMDARGNNSIMFAAAADQHDVIELLLNYGADVNSFNDENLTPLNLCLLRRIAEAASLGNWEISFLAPDSSAPGGGLTERETKTWRTVESTVSLDRIFGDGMSAYDRESVDEIAEFSLRDSVFFFDDSDDNDDSQEDSSAVTLLTFKANNAEVRDDVSERTTSQAVGNRGSTAKVSKGLCPKSFKREEYLRSVAEPRQRDKYFFQLNVDKGREEGEEEHKSGSSAADEIASRPTVRSQALSQLSQKHFSVFNDRLFKIDRTIEQLLKRGADPNLGDAPKPSLHLALYSADLNLVRLLLTYGAAPDSQTLPQEGLLTPLHVVALMEPGEERVAMCELLLNHGASPEEETAPNFRPNGETDFLLDVEHGRTPLQLLCTRRDAERGDPEGFLSRLALLLANVSGIDHFFRGHSYLTLAMISGNYALAEALLTSKRVDPNQVLGRDLGTALHVLVTAEFQRRAPFPDSIRMCDLLLERGANPHLRFRTPHSLAGTCIDYGYREIEREKNRELSSETIKPEARHYLENHMRVVQYLEKRSKHGDENGKDQGVKKGLGIEGEGKKSRGRRRSKSDKGDGVSGEGRSRKNEEEKGENKSRDVGRNENNQISGGTRGGGANQTGQEAKIIEIKKHVEKGTPRKLFGVKDAARRLTDKKTGRKGENEKKAERISTTRKMSKDKSNMRRTDGGGSERLPERFRQSLLHMFGICGERLSLNDFLLPYVVLRNGDLYYRFKGGKPPGTEQYSLI